MIYASFLMSKALKIEVVTERQICFETSYDT